MVAKIDLSKILFLDIETVPLVYNHKDLDEKSQDLWNKKTTFLQQREGLGPDEIYDKAGIYAEFGKIVCISVGFVVQIAGEMQIRLKR